MANLDGERRLADATLRAAGNSVATLLVCVAAGDSSDDGQIGLDTPQYQKLEVCPAILRRTRATMLANEPSRYELLLSPTSVESYVSSLQLASAEALFQMCNAVLYAGGRFELEAWSYSAVSGGAFLYRIQLRSAEQGSLV
jgi:hypothetical protein